MWISSSTNPKQFSFLVKEYNTAIRNGVILRTTRVGFLFREVYVIYGGKIDLGTLRKGLHCSTCQ